MIPSGRSGAAQHGRASLPRRRRPLLAVAVALAVAASSVLVAACSGDHGDRPGPGVRGPAPSRPGTLRILAGSELRDIEPMLGDLKAATGITVSLSYVGTLDGVDRVTSHTAGADAAWFSSDRYLRLVPGGPATELARTPIMTSPVVLGVRTDVARRLGWTGDQPVTWADIAAKVAAGQLTYAMTNPAASNSGFSALVGVAAALAGTADALRTSDIRPGALTTFFSGQTLTAGSSGWLADAFVRSPAGPDAMINYESVLLSLQRAGTPPGGLTIVRPADGVITADYPLMLLDANRRDEYTRVVGWLRSPAVQRRLQDRTNRRPTVPGVRLDPRFGTGALVELPFPATQQVADQLLDAYLDTYRRPTHAIFVLDLSGSMAGQRLTDLRAALTGLAGADDGLTGRFTRFRAREQVTIITFSGAVDDVRTFTVTDPSAGSADLRAITDYAGGLRAAGATAVYSALDRAYDTAEQAIRADPAPLRSIVLMTDGESNTGLSAQTFRDHLDARAPDVRAVRTFAVVFGDADSAELSAIATTTGGAVFDARSTSLSAVFREIRGYQ